MVGDHPGIPPGANHAPLTPLSFLARAREVCPDHTAIIQGDRTWTYTEMADECARLAHALGRAGIRAGDRVAYLAPNTAELLIAHFAVPLAGAVLVALNTRLAGDEIGYILRHSGARILVVDASLLETAEHAAPDCPELENVIVSGASGEEPRAGYRGFADFVSGPVESEISFTVADEDAPIAINYTSGTTGRPKGVVYTHRGAYLNSLGEVIHSRHGPESVYLWTLPMFHCNGWCTTWAVTGMGGTHVCLSRVDPDEVWRLIDRHGVTHFNAAPTVLVALLGSVRRHALARPVTVTTAGAPPSPSTIRQLQETGFNLVHVYGLTEVYGPYTVCERRPSWPDPATGDDAALLARQGVGMIQTDGVRVVDDSMNDAPKDGTSIGEIVMRGNNVMNGYYRDDDATAEAFRGGWFHSGDLGVWHPDGYVELRDRAKDLIISGGENISTVEVENCIMERDEVLEVAIVGVPDDKWGERPKAFVVPREASTISTADIIEHVRSRLARFKEPRDVQFCETLPKTSTGKIQKYALREAEWDGYTKRIKG